MGKIKTLKTASNIDVIYETLSKEIKHAHCEYVGCSQKDFIIVRYPVELTPRHDRDPLSAGHIIKLRAVSNQNSLETITFTSTILKTITTSERLLFITYPEQTESKMLRAEPRLNVELMAQINFDDENISAKLCLIKDVSPSGICCEFSPKNKQDKYQKLLNKQCTLSFDISMYGDNTFHTLDGIVKNVQGTEKIQLGLCFTDDNLKKVKTFFDELVIENMLY